MKAKHQVRVKKLSTEHLIRNLGVLIIFIILGFATVFTIASLAKNPPLPKYSGPVEHITTANVGEYSSLSIIAQKMGFFKDNGLVVTMQDAPSGPVAVSDLLDGKVDTATAADFVGVINIFDNKKLKVLLTQARPFSFFMVARNDHNIQVPTDLRGKKIGVTGKSAGEFHLGQYLTLNKLSYDQVSIVYGSPSDLKNMIIKGELDAIVSFDPHVHEARKTLKDKAIIWSVQGEQRHSTLLYGTDKLIRERPEAVRRYIAALVEAEDYIQGNDVESRDIVAKYLKYNEEQINNAWKNITFDVSLDQDLIISMEDQALWAIENKLTKATNVPDFLQFIYFDGLEAVKPYAITIIR